MLALTCKVDGTTIKAMLDGNSATVYAQYQDESIFRDTAERLKDADKYGFINDNDLYYSVVPYDPLRFKSYSEKPREYRFIDDLMYYDMVSYGIDKKHRIIKVCGKVNKSYY